MRLPIKGKKRRKLLVLISAYLDAGEPSPAVRVLAKRTGLTPLQVIARTPTA